MDICSCSFDFALPVFTDLDFQSIWEFRKIGKYSLGKYLNIPSLNLFEKWEKLWSTAYWPTFENASFPSLPWIRKKMESPA